MAGLQYHKLMGASLISIHVAITGVTAGVQEVGQRLKVDGAVGHGLGQGPSCGTTGQGGEDEMRVIRDRWPSVQVCNVTILSVSRRPWCWSSLLGVG